MPLAPGPRVKLLLASARLLGCSGEWVDVGEHSLDVRVCPSGKIVDGIDVSAYQGTVDWTQVRAAGKRFAFMRVNHGLGNVDPTFPGNWSGSHAAGLIRGPYQFFLAS